jgi:hypothetical protein
MRSEHRGTDEPGDQIVQPSADDDESIAPTPRDTGSRTLDTDARAAGGRWHEPEPSQAPGDAPQPGSTRERDSRPGATGSSS